MAGHLHLVDIVRKPAGENGMNIFERWWRRRENRSAGSQDYLIEGRFSSLRRFSQLLPKGSSEPGPTVEQFEVLQFAVFSLMQDVVALKAYLAETGKWYPNVYERLRREVIESDAYSGGADGILHHSYIQYFLDPDDLLRYSFKASKTEADDFMQHLDWMMSRLT